MEKINRDMAAGAGWMVFFKLVDKSLGVVSTLILARLLVPADFGLVALARAVVAGLELMSAFSFDIALIQNPNADRRHYDTAWTFNVLFGLLIAGALVLVAVPAGAFYNDSRLSGVLFALAIGQVVQGFENVGIVAFRKEMQFGRDFAFLLARKLGSFIVTIPLAFVIRNYWALVVGTLASGILGVTASYIVQSYRPRFSLSARSDLFHFSKWLVLNNITLFFRTRSSDFIVGKIAGAGGLGVFSLAYEVSNLPTTELVAPINRAVFPAYAKMSTDRHVLRQGFLNVLGAIAFFAIPAGVGIASTASLLVPIALGEKWLPAIPLIQILSIYGVLGAVQTNTGSVYLALGQPRIVYWVTVLWLALLLPLSVTLTTLFGIVGAAFACLGTVSVVLPVNCWILLRRLGIPLRALLDVVWRPALGSLVMFVLVRATLPGATGGFALQLTRLLSSVVLGAVTYGAVVLVLWRLSSRPDSAEKFVLERGRKLLRRVIRFGQRKTPADEIPVP